MIKKIIGVILLIIIILIAMGYCSGRRSVSDNSNEIRVINVTFNKSE